MIPIPCSRSRWADGSQAVAVFVRIIPAAVPRLGREGVPTPWQDPPCGGLIRHLRASATSQILTGKVGGTARALGGPLQPFRTRAGGAKTVGARMTCGATAFVHEQNWALIASTRAVGVSWICTSRCLQTTVDCPRSTWPHRWNCLETRSVSRNTWSISKYSNLTTPGIPASVCASMRKPLRSCCRNF